MSKVLVVFGATGNQGGSVVNAVLSDSQLSKEFRIRGLTRDPSKPQAQELAKQGVEVIACDVDDGESVKNALKDAHTVFLNTVSTASPRDEFQQGKTAADACVAANVSLLIYSSSTHVIQISGGKYNNVTMFDCKADVEDYIRSLPIMSSFYVPGSFMQNYLTQMAPRPSRDNDGTYAVSLPFPETTQFPLIDIESDTGKFVAAVLASPEKFKGKDIAAAEHMYTFSEIVQTMSRVTGKTVKFNQLPPDVFKSFLPPERATAVSEMLLHISEFGYYGPKTKELVEQDSQLARGRLVTLEEYLTKNLKLN